jgi:hypothetical protein
MKRIIFALMLIPSISFAQTSLVDALIKNKNNNKNHTTGLAQILSPAIEPEIESKASVINNLINSLALTAAPSYFYQQNAELAHAQTKLTYMEIVRRQGLTGEAAMLSAWIMEQQGQRRVELGY